MEVHLALGQPARLLDSQDLRRFSVTITAAPDALPALAEAQRGIIDFDGTDHAWVSVAWLIEASGHADGAEWLAAFQAMTAYAAKQGWLREEPAAIRGHLVWQTGAA